MCKKWIWNKRIWFDMQMMIHSKFAPRTNDQCRWNMNQLSYRIFSLLSWCILETNGRSRHQRGKQKIVTYITQNFSYHRPCLYIQVHGRENTASSNLIEGTSPRISHSVVLACISKDTTERTLPTKGCLV